MIVNPRIIRRKLQNNEIRVINVDYHAVLELLSEKLMDAKTFWFDVPAVDENQIFSTMLDLNTGILTFTVMPLQYALEGKQLSYEYLRQEIGLTSESLFDANTQKYRSLEISDDIFLNN